MEGCLHGSVQSGRAWQIAPCYGMLGSPQGEKGESGIRIRESASSDGR